MNITIVGCGKVGYTLAQYLVADGHDITIIDKEEKGLLKASETLDVKCVRGNGANMKTLLETDIEEADVIIAVTGNDELNMVCCLCAKQMGAKYSIARVRNPEYYESINSFQDKLAIDAVINPERSTALEISRLIRFPASLDIEYFAHGKVEMVGFIAEEKDDVVGVPMHKLHKRYPQIQFNAAHRGNKVFIPNGDFVIQPGDRIYAIGDRESITNFFRALGKNEAKLKSAMVIGGGHIAYYLAKALSGQPIKLRILEIDEERCKTLSSILENVEILNEDGTDQGVLDDENISTCGAMICLTNRDEENVIAGLYGARHGAQKVIVKINRMNTTDVLDGMGINSVVSPKLTTANSILRTVRALDNSQGTVVEKIYRILDGQVDAYEFEVKNDAAYLDIPLINLGIRKGILVSVIVRNGKCIIPFGGDKILAGDRVILTVKAGTVINLEDAFNIAEAADEH